MDWRGSCIVLLYKQKSDMYECSSSRGNSLFCVVGTLFGIVLIKSALNVQQGRECMDQVFAVRQVCKVTSKWNVVF